VLDIHELKTFLSAAETENFSEAARQLNLTQPAVSMQIRAMEKRLGLNLFHRTGRTLTLTEQPAPMWNIGIFLMTTWCW